MLSHEINKKIEQACPHVLLQQISIDSWYAAPQMPAPALSSKPAARRCCCRLTGQTD